MRGLLEGAADPDDLLQAERSPIGTIRDFTGRFSPAFARPSIAQLISATSLENAIIFRDDGEEPCNSFQRPKCPFSENIWNLHVKNTFFITSCEIHPSEKTFWNHMENSRATEQRCLSDTGKSGATEQRCFSDTRKSRATKQGCFSDTGKSGATKQRFPDMLKNS